MRKLLALILIFALCACAPAWAEGVTDALGLTGSGESSVRGDLSARTDTDLYVVTNDGSDKMLMRIPRAGGASVRVESAGSISDLVPAGDLLYFLRVNNGTATLMRRNTDSTRSEVYTFPLGSSVSALSYYGGNLYALIDNQLNVIYPATGQCTLLSGTAMLDYVIVGDTVYYISGSDMMPYQTASLLGNGSLTAEGGCLYRMNMSTGESSLVIKAGIEDLRYCDGALYFHNLSDNYVMGDASREWMEGKLYRYDLESEQNLRMLDSYDWGFYPMEGGVAIYTDGDLSYYNALGGRERTMSEPEAYAVLSGGGAADIQDARPGGQERKRGKAGHRGHYRLPDRDEGLLLAFRRPESVCPEAELFLEGLCPEGRYETEDADTGARKILSGAELSRLTLRLPQRPSSALLFYRRV